MKNEFTAILNDLFRESDKSFKDMEADFGYSERTFRRWLSGDTEPTVSVFYKVVEYLGGNRKDVQARIGMKALEEWEKFGYKNAKELIEDFNIERAKMEEAHKLEKKAMLESHEESKRIMREEHAAQVEKLKSLRLELQEQFQSTINLLTDRYNANSKFLIENALKIERLNDQLTERATRAEKRIDDLNKRSHHVFWGMMALVVIMLTLLVLGVILDLPMIGMGNG